MNPQSISARVGAAAPQVHPSQLEVDGRTVMLDAAGFLVDSEEWTEAVAAAMAQVDGIQLSDDHWTVINFLHRYYRELGVAPEMAILRRQLCKSMNDCKWDRRFITQLFPNGAARQACRYAGLPQPVGRGCD